MLGTTPLVYGGGSASERLVRFSHCYGVLEQQLTRLDFTQENRGSNPLHPTKMKAMNAEEIRELREVAAEAARWLSVVKCNHSEADNIPNDLVARLASTAQIRQKVTGVNTVWGTPEYEWVLI